MRTCWVRSPDNRKFHKSPEHMIIGLNLTLFFWFCWMLFCMKLHKYSMVFYFLVLFICHHPCRSQSCWTWNPNPSGPHPTASSRRSGDSDGCGSNHRKRDRASYQFHDHSQPSNKINMLNNLATTTPSMTCRISDMRICWTKRTRHASFQ